MDRTDSAKLFRDAIINELQAGVAVAKAYQTAVQSTFQTPLSEEFENDTTNSLSISNRGIMLWSLKSVTVLGMFMTKTDSAKLFRDLIIEELTKEVKFEEAYQTVLETYKKKKNMDYLPIFSISSNFFSNLFNTLKLLQDTNVCITDTNTTNTTTKLNVDIINHPPKF